MPNYEKKIFYVTQAQYDILKNDGTVGSYTGIDPDATYFVRPIPDNYELFWDNNENQIQLLKNGVGSGDPITIQYASFAANAGLLSGFLASDFVNTYEAQIIGGDKTFSNNVVISGDLTVQGTNTILNTQTVSTEDDIIQLRSSATTPMTSYAGLVATKYDGTNDGALVFDNTGTAKIGDVTINGDGTITNVSMQKIATREDTPVDTGVTFWDVTTQKFLTNAGLKYNVGINRFIPDNIGVTGGAFFNNLSSFNGVPSANINLNALGTIITRNIADANPTLVVNQIHASSTGDILKVQAAGTDRLTVKRDGKVGIGTSTPSSKLTITGAGSQLHATRTDGGIVASFSNEGYNAALNISSYAVNTILLQSGSAHKLGLSTNNSTTPNILIDTAGKVGIGTDTPGEKLHVIGKGLFNNGGNFYIDSKASNVSLATDALRSITFNTNSLNRMVIASDGNIGINNENPTAQLEVKSSATTKVPMIVDALTAQTANLQEWKVNGITLAYLDKDGNFSAGTLNTGAGSPTWTIDDTTENQLTFKDGANTRLRIKDDGLYVNNSTTPLGSGTVTSVSATSNLESSGGTTPEISVTSGYTIPSNTEITAWNSLVGHTHITTITEDSGTNQLSLMSNTKYKLTAGGTSYIFTTPIDNNTLNTAGSLDTGSKIYLVGTTSQTSSAQTYSDNEVYVTNGILTTKEVQVGGTAATMKYDSTSKSVKFVFA